METRFLTEKRKMVSGTLPSSKYKGVVPQPNGRWGAQIYDKHQRVWLGTFNDEYEAASAYDVAARRFRGRDAVVNFVPTDDDGAEAAFLESHSKDDIVDMLRKHTYSDELAQCKKTYWFDGGDKRIIIKDPSGAFGAYGRGRAREDLFEKALTPSDVGKLNRLVVPKQHAEKHFLPLNDLSCCPNDGTHLSTSDTCCRAVFLNFEDAGGKVWRFRFSYGNSSQSYVLTKGWRRFVKEKNLKAGDTVTFHRSTGPDKKRYIDFKGRGNRSSSSVIGSVADQPVRLFGVNISHAGEGDRGESHHCGGGNKRVRDQMNKLWL